MKPLLHTLLLITLASCIAKSKQRLPQNKPFRGKYVENNVDTNLLFKGELVLLEDSLFRYKSLGAFQDTASGTFTLIVDTLLFKYADGYTDLVRKTYHDTSRPVPIELLGYGVQFDGRPLQLVIHSDTLFYIDSDRMRDEKEGLYYLLRK